MGHTRLTLLVEDLANLARAVSGAVSYPNIELLLARGKCTDAAIVSADEQRMRLFDSPSGQVPVGALTQLAEGIQSEASGHYWLRVDAVSLRADMTRVFVTGAGLEDMVRGEQQGICRCIEEVFEQEGLDFRSGRIGRWALALDSSPGFGFMPLEEALGLDMAEALPSDPEARAWRRIMNEAQVALHNHPVNAARRQSGQLEINGIWIWGGGYLPDAATARSFETVFSSHPVSRGLALLNGCELLDLQSFDPAESRGGHRALLDWTVESSDARAELDRLEELAGYFVNLLRKGSMSLLLVGPDGRSWEVDRKALRRLWRRPAPLLESIRSNSR